MQASVVELRLQGDESGRGQGGESLPVCGVFCSTRRLRSIASPRRMTFCVISENCSSRRRLGVLADSMAR